MKRIQKPAGHSLKIKYAVFFWIVFCNLLVQAFHHQLEGWGIASWNLFLVNILFFMMEEEPYKERLIRCGCGVIVGLLSVWFLCVVNGAVTAAGLPHIVAVMIPLTVVLFLIIIGGAYCPTVFNSVGFAYFMVGLIDPGTTFAHLGTYMVGGLLGNLLINGTAALLIQYMIRHFQKKAAALQKTE